MKKYNFFFNGTPITRAQFESVLYKKNWEKLVVNGEFTWGYYRATLID